MELLERSLGLRCYPKDDAIFAAVVRRTVEEVRASVHHPERLRAAVERRLRQSYPRVRIEARQAVAAPTRDADPVWYCYRDGSLAG